MNNWLLGLQHVQTLLLVLTDGSQPEEKTLDTLTGLAQVQDYAHRCDVAEVGRTKRRLKQITQDAATPKFVSVYLHLELLVTFIRELKIQSHSLLDCLPTCELDSQSFKDQGALATLFVANKYEDLRLRLVLSAYTCFRV